MATNQTNQTGPGGGPEFSTALIYGSSVLNILISVLTLVGNTLVLASFVRTPKLRRCQTNYFIVSLAIADLISGCIAVPLWTTVVLGRFRSFVGFSPLYLSYQVFDVFSGVASILHLMFISLERYFAIVWPIVHHVAQSTTYFIVMAIIWVVSITASVVSLEAAHYREKYVIFNSVTLFGLPFVVIIFSYLSILRATLRRSSIKSTRSLDRELKVAMTVFILVALFVITWCPFFTIALVSLHCRGCFSMAVIIFLKCLHYSNSFCNPIIYAARIPDFRKAFQNLLPKKLFIFLSCRVQENDSPTTSRIRSCSGMSLPDGQAAKASRKKLGVLVDDKDGSVRGSPASSYSGDTGILNGISPLTDGDGFSNTRL